MGPEIGKQLLYLSRADVAACDLEARDMNDAIESMFKAKAEGRAWTQPKMSIFRPDGASFRAKGGAISDPDYGAMKLFGYFPGNERHGLPDFVPLIVLNEGRSGMPVAVMDGVRISALRTGSISAVAAKYMAQPDSRSVGFVACGTQARSNLDALMAMFPLKRVVAYSRRLSTAEAFAAEARLRGLDARAVSNPRDAIVGVDIVVSCVPHASPEARFLDAADVSPGTFVSMVDLGYGWKKETLAHFERVITDDLEQSGPGGSEKLNYDGEYQGEVADIVSAKIPGRAQRGERNALIFAGTGLADTAAAVAVYERALQKQVGTILPL